MTVFGAYFHGRDKKQSRTRSTKVSNDSVGINTTRFRALNQKVAQLVNENHRAKRCIIIIARFVFFLPSCFFVCLFGCVFFFFKEYTMQAEITDLEIHTTAFVHCTSN
jgi:hypothetical protein